MLLGLDFAIGELLLICGVLVEIVDLYLARVAAHAQYGSRIGDASLHVHACCVVFGVE